MNKKRLFLLAGSLLLAYIGLCAEPRPVTGSVAIGSHTAVTPTPRPEREWWMPRHQAILERLAQGNVDLIWIGDSITHSWEEEGKDIWARYYASRNAVNLGCSGDRTQNVLWRLQNGEIDNIQPKVAIIMIGTNNSNRDEHTAEEIADGIKAIVITLREKLPETKILVLSIFPRGDATQKALPIGNASYNDQWAKNDQASRLASVLADDQMVFFLDINKAFLNEEGELTREMMPDLLHPKEKGYQVWAETMEPTLMKLLGETK